MKRTFLFCFFFLIPVLLFAEVSLDFALQNAMENSSEVKNARISYENALITLQKNALKDGFSLDFGLGEDFKNLPTASVSVTFPEFVENLKISAGFGTQTEVLSKDYLLLPSASVSYMYDVGPFKDTREDVLALISGKQADLNYARALLEAENSIIQNMISLTETMQNIKQAGRNIEKTEESIKSRLALKTLSPSSLTYMKESVALEQSKKALEVQQESYKQALDAFRTAYGVEFEIFTCDFCHPDETSIAMSNTALEIAALRTEVAKQNLEEKEGKSAVLDVGALINPTINPAADGKFQMSGSAYAGYSDNNILAQVKYNYDSQTKSSVSFTGKISKSQKKTKSDEYELALLRNDYISAQSSYENAVISFNQSRQALISDIASFNADLQIFESKCEYNTAVFDKMLDLFNSGLVSKSEKEDCEFTIETDKIQRTVYALKSRIYANKIKLLNL